MSIGERIAERIEALGLNQSELARRVGVTPGLIAQLVGGAVRSSKHLHKIARELRTSVAYLEGETDDPAAGAATAPTEREIAEHFDLVPINRIDLSYGLGATFSDMPVEVEVDYFPRAWIRTITHSPPADLAFTRGSGDSMVPTIHNGDLILFDRSKKTVDEQDALWAFTMGDIAMIKRLRVRGAQVTILSDSDVVPPDTAHADEINIVGRVIFIGRRI